jgi:plastocyanin
VTQRSLIFSILSATALLASVATSAQVAARLGSEARPIPAVTTTGFRAATVAVGSVVWFVNADGKPHNAIGRGINSGVPVTGIGTTFRAIAPRRPGRYSYICGVHTNMRGVLTVVKK